MAKLFRPTELSFTTDTVYENPFLDVDVTAEFIHRQTKERIFLSGFWNGGNTWCVRFAPTLLGEWDYTVTSNDASLNSTGTVIGEENDKLTEIDRRGYVRIRQNARFFEYSDGTPFFWLGDTHWQAPELERMDECNYPGCNCNNSFKHMVDKRAEQGFNVFQTYPSAADNDGGGGKRLCNWWKTRYTLIDPESFKEQFDKKMDYLLEKGFTIALGFGVHNSTPNAMGDTLKDFARYVVARYAAYPVIWITGQEVDMCKLHGNDAGHRIWLDAAEMVYKYDGYRHPEGTHMCSAPYMYEKGCSYEYEQLPWHNFWALQQGHNYRVLRDIIKYEDYYRMSDKPYVETECYYEDLRLGDPLVPNLLGSARYGAWVSNLAGCCGFTYGVQGVWGLRWSKDPADGGWASHYNSEPWFMGLEKMGGYEMQYLKEFFENIDFTRLTPAFYDEHYGKFSNREKAVMANDRNNLYVVYIYGPDSVTGTLLRMHKGKTYKQYWYDTRCGRYIFIGEVSDVYSTPLPERPDKNDWVYILTCEDINTPYMGEVYHNECLPDILGAPVAFAAETVFSRTEEDRESIKFGRRWSPFCPKSSNIIKFDLQTELPLASIRLILEANRSKKYTYRIYGVKDGRLTVLCDRIAEPSNTPINVEKVTGTYRYLILQFFSDTEYMDKENGIVAGIEEILVCRECRY